MEREAQQFDLFSGAEPAHLVPSVERRPIEVGRLDDAALIAALPGAGQIDAPVLAEACGQRKLTNAIPALEALCRRFKGFGLRAIVPEQRAALAGLVGIGGSAAADAVLRLLVSGTVQGPGLPLAVAAAASLGAILPPSVALEWLRHADPALRAGTCRFVRPVGDVINVLLDLLADLHSAVADAAACALGRGRRVEARSHLGRCLTRNPTREVIEAFAAIADDDGVVLLGRIVSSHPEFVDAVLDALEVIDTDRASVVAAGVRRRRKL